MTSSSLVWIYLGVTPIIHFFLSSHLLTLPFPSLTSLTHSARLHVRTRTASSIFLQGNHGNHIYCDHGPLTIYVKVWVAYASGMRETFIPPPRVSDPNLHHGTCVTHVPWCMSGSLTSGFLWSWWQGKRSRHSWRMRNPQFYVSGKRPMLLFSVFSQLGRSYVLVNRNLDEKWLLSNFDGLVQDRSNSSALALTAINKMSLQLAAFRQWCFRPFGWFAQREGFQFWHIYYDSRHV